MDVSIDLSQTTIETLRLTLRPWTETDVEDFFEYASVPGVGEMAGWKHHASPEASWTVLQSFIASGSVLAITLNESGKVIGSIGLHAAWSNMDDAYRHLPAKEIGYVLAKPYWGMGLMPEAVHAMIRYCFDVCRLEALTVAHFVDNPQSQRVIEKCGFQYVRHSTFYAQQLDKTIEDRQYILLK